MTRNTFLATIAAIFTALFTYKRKVFQPQQLPTAQDLIDLENSISVNYRTPIPAAEWVSGVQPYRFTSKIKVSKELSVILEDSCRFDNLDERTEYYLDHLRENTKNIL